MAPVLPVSQVGTPAFCEPSFLFLTPLLLRAQLLGDLT